MTTINKLPFLLCAWLLLPLAAPAGSIDVYGSAHAVLPNDAEIVTVSVVTDPTTAGKVASLNDSIAAVKVITDKLLAAGVLGSDITVGAPVYTKETWTVTSASPSAPPDPNAPSYVAPSSARESWRVERQLTFTLRDLSRLNDTLTGMGNINVTHMVTTSSDPTGATNDAIKAAMAAATARAQIIAAGFGVALDTMTSSSVLAPTAADPTLVMMHVYFSTKPLPPPVVAPK